MDWKEVLEIAITTIATGITTFVLSVLKRHKNNQFETEKRLTKLEAFQNANYETMKDIKKDLDIIRDYIMKGKR